MYIGLLAIDEKSHQLCKSQIYTNTNKQLQ